jgi:predicted SAM-dependent methyltransferase/ADP-heptose:LPS heptosyltransferase
MAWRAEDPQGNEAGKIKWEIVKWTRGRGLDIGAGLYRTFPHFITVDNNIDAHIFGHTMPRPDLYVEDASDLGLVATESMNFVFSSHMLEHVEPQKLVKTLKEWLRVVKMSGYLVLYLPDEDQYPKMGEPGANPDHKWNVSYDKVVELMEKAGTWDLLDFQKRSSGFEYSLFFVFQKRHRGHAFSWQKPKPTKTVGVVRYGAVGDMMQASSVWAALKAEGYHVTLYCAEGQCEEVVRADPNIDDFYIQGRGQVPDAALGPFWEWQQKKYDRWVNLSESVEGGLLTMANRIVDTYTPAVRHALLNKNYLAYQHFIAGVPLGSEEGQHPIRVKFYPSPAEEMWAAREREKYGSFLVLWAMNGSSVHKVWPGLDAVVSGLLIDFPEVEIMFVGGPDGVVLEQGWEKTPRVHCRSAQYNIRETLSLSQLADVVIGPETGVLNAVAHEPMPKVCFLSHSTQENLTRDWVNTHSLASLGTHCAGRGRDEAPACHRLHFGWTRCTEAQPEAGTEHLYPRKGAGYAQCQADISAQDAYKVIWHVVQWQLEAYAKRDGRDMPGVVKLSEEQVRKVRGTFPSYMQAPAQVIEELENPPEKSVIEA